MYTGFMLLLPWMWDVVVDVPQLYDLDVLAQGVINFNDVNSFLPMCPIAPGFREIPIVKRVRGLLERVEVSPFQEWNRLLGKGMTFLYSGRMARVHPDIGEEIFEELGE
jgi:hypothetical protein